VLCLTRPLAIARLCAIALEQLVADPNNFAA
jgi:hypothetical protein